MLNVESTHDLAIPLLGTYPKELRAGSQGDIHGSTVHSSPKAETTQASGG